MGHSRHTSYTSTKSSPTCNVCAILFNDIGEICVCKITSLVGVKGWQTLHFQLIFQARCPAQAVSWILGNLWYPVISCDILWYPVISCDPVSREQRNRERLVRNCFPQSFAVAHALRGNKMALFCSSKCSSLYCLKPPFSSCRSQDLFFSRVLKWLRSNFLHD